MDKNQWESQIQFSKTWILHSNSLGGPLIKVYIESEDYIINNLKIEEFVIIEAFKLKGPTILPKISIPLSSL